MPESRYWGPSPPSCENGWTPLPIPPGRNLDDGERVAGGLGRQRRDAIPKAARAEHAEDNARAAEIDLTEEELRRIGEAFPRGPRRRGVPTL